MTLHDLVIASLWALAACCITVAFVRIVIIGRKKEDDDSETIHNNTKQFREMMQKDDGTRYESTTMHDKRPTSIQHEHGHVPPPLVEDQYGIRPGVRPNVHGTTTGRTRSSMPPTQHWSDVARRKQADYEDEQRRKRQADSDAQHVAAMAAITAVVTASQASETHAAQPTPHTPSPTPSHEHGGSYGGAGASGFDSSPASTPDTSGTP